MIPRLRTLVPAAGAFLIPFLIGLAVHDQGFNLLDDGLWLLGGRLVAEGGVLYRDLFSIYGPARYLLLAPFLLAMGQKVAALAVLKAVLDGTAGLLGWIWCRRLGAGRWAWLVPLGVIAIAPVYPRYLAAAALAAWAGGHAWTGRRAFLTGCFWGGLATFGLDMAAYGAVILAAGWFAAGRPRGAIGRAFGGGAVVVGLMAGVLAAQGAFGDFWWAAVVYPATRFGGAMGLSWADTFADGTRLGEVFAGLHTGEALRAAWPGQGALRTAGLRLMILLVWAAPVALLVSAWRARDSRAAVLAFLGLAGWATVAARGDVEHVKLAWWAVLLISTVLIGRAAGRRPPAGLAGGLVLVVALGPLAAEALWLAANRGREGLVRWDRPAAGILLAENRRDALEEIATRIDEIPDDTVLAWPAQPGLQFLAGRRPPVAQATLLPGEVRDARALVAGLAAAAPDRLVLGPAWGLVPGIRSLRRLEPAVYSYLRENYRVDHEVALMGETFRFVRRVPEGRAGIMALPPALRLPGAAHYLKTGTSPALEPGVEIVQTFDVEDFDLSGLALIFTSPGPFPYRVDFELGILAVEPGGAVQVVVEIPLTITLEQQGQKHSFPLSPIGGSRGRKMGVRIRDLSGGERPFALMWHQPDRDAGGLDYHPEGGVYLNGQPQDADLTFTTW